jgi:hypothetical protein
MPRAEFEPTISVFERAKIVYALDLAAIVKGRKEAIRPYLRHTMGTKLAKSEALLNTQDYSYTRLSTQGLTYPQRRFRRIGYIGNRVPGCITQNDSKLLSGFPWPIYRNPDNN